MNNDTTPAPEVPDPLDALLRQAEPHIPDAGFTQRVLAALPPRRRADPWRLALFAAAWLAGAVILLLRVPGAVAAPMTFLRHVFQGELAPLLALAPVMFALCCLGWAAVTWALEESA